MNIVYKEHISIEEYNKLRVAVGWEKICDEQVRNGLKHSAYVVSCYEYNKVIGMARIIWDNGYIAYLADVMVIPEYQRMGIGRHLVEKAIDFMRSQLKEGWKINIVLHSAKGKEGFYKKFDFDERPSRNGGAGMELRLE